jgi:hypothetical protein
MTKKHGIFGFIVMLLTIMFALAGCENATDSKELDDYFVDTYTHASQQYAIAALPGVGAINSKTILDPAGAEYAAAIRFIQDYSHYLYVERNVSAGFFAFPAAGTDDAHSANWTSYIVPASGNRKPYVAPAGDPLCRGVNVLSINPNGTVTASHGSYWGTAPAGVDLSDLDMTNAYGWTPSDKPQPFIYFTTGQTTTNLIERKRGTLVIDAELSDRAPYSIERARYLFVEVKLRSYEQRRVSFEEFFKGMYPGGTAMSFREIMAQDAGVTLLTHAEYWGVATNTDPAWAGFLGLAENNLTSDQARADYIAGLSANPEAERVRKEVGPDYLWFDILQITKVAENLGWEFNKTEPYDPAGAQP